MSIAESDSKRCSRCGGVDFLGVEGSPLCAECLHDDHLEAMAHTAPSPGRNITNEGRYPG